MNCANHESPNMPIYALFESTMRNGIRFLTVQPESIVSGIKYSKLPPLTETIEKFELEITFPGATCLIYFEQSVVYKDLFFTMTYFDRHKQPTLDLDDFLANRKDQRQSYLSFKTSECTLEQGISRIVDVLVSLFNNELLPLLEGKIWFTAPIDWGDYK
jgi:hypothetical protein